VITISYLCCTPRFGVILPCWNSLFHLLNHSVAGVDGIANPKHPANFLCAPVGGVFAPTISNPALLGFWESELFPPLMLTVR
jgi:hypothetical protein